MPQSSSNKYYYIVWKYFVKPEYKLHFEHEYSTKGSWVTLFSQSPYHKQSSLHPIPHEAPNAYLVIDLWTSKEAYDEFLARYEQDYKKLSMELAYLYESEENIGAFYTGLE